MDTTVIDDVLGSGIPYITYAVPVFFLLIGVEVLVGILARRRLYRVNDSINDLSCGVLQQVVGVFMKATMFLGYIAIYEHYHWLEVESFSAAGKWAAAIVLFLGVDFAYYWFHRIAHEWNAPWATHVVHHQSEEYNLAVALRQGTFQGVFSWVFYTPLLLIGFPPLWLAAVMSFDTLYQFWIHTRAIDRLGPLEYVLNTPSHHRVHHARNPKYLDKNYAGTLIIWDKMFGTFIAEEEEPVYGLTKPLNSWNPLWANFHIWQELIRDAYLAPKWKDRFKIWFMPPGWRPDGLTPNPHGPQVTRDTVIKYDTEIPKGLTTYVITQFTLTLVISVMFLSSYKQLPGSVLIALAVWIIWGLTNIGAIYERRRWAMPSELLRLGASLAGCLVWQVGLVSGETLPNVQTIALPAAGGFVILAAWLWMYRKEFTGVTTFYRGREPGLIKPEAVSVEPVVQAASVAKEPVAG